MRDTPKHATYLYLLFTVLFSSVIWALVIWSGHLGMAFGTMIVAVMWCPALATWVTCRVIGRSFRSLAWGWPQARYIAAAYFIPLAYTVVAYGAVWAFRLGGWNSDIVKLVAERFGLRGMPVWGSFALWLVFTGTASLIRGLSTALGRRDWLARFSGSRAGEANVVYPAQSAERRDLGGMAQSAAAVCRLQLGDKPLVRAELLHGDDHRRQLHLRLVAAEVGQPVDGGRAARQP